MYNFLQNNEFFLTPDPPPNVIRIETQDDSDEFIEIVLPTDLEINDPPLQDVSDMFFLAVKGASSLAKGAKGLKFFGSLTRQEVLDIVNKLPTARELGISQSRRVHLVKNIEEFNELVNKFTKNAKYIGKHSRIINVKKTNQKEEVEILDYILDDGTPIGIRSNSQTGGGAIDINKKEKIIHNLETIRK